jgi:hypothetical protein
MTAMGISSPTGFEVEGRPYYVTQDGQGILVESLFG